MAASRWTLRLPSMASLKAYSGSGLLGASDRLKTAVSSLGVVPDPR